jgi:catalase
MDLSERLVDAINAVSGAHPGTRAAHAKGMVCAGSFKATPEAAALTRAPHMQGDEVRATVRFSNGSGNPHARDAAREGRGIAVKLYLPDDSRTDLLGLTRPVFFVRTPEDFEAFMHALVPDPETGNPDPAKVGPFVEAHPEVMTAIQALLTTPPPASYATIRYHGIHAFRWVDADGGSRFVRYRWEPVAGEAYLSDEEAGDLGRDYLQEELLERFDEGPVELDLLVQIAEDGDPIDDPTVAWPEERDVVNVGRFIVTGLDTERERDGDVLVFDPTRVTDGIELSGDLILRARPGAYSVSVERRSGAPRPAAATA